MYIYFREEGKGREININDEAESLIGCLLKAPLGIEPATQ